MQKPRWDWALTMTPVLSFYCDGSNELMAVSSVNSQRFVDVAMPIPYKLRFSIQISNEPGFQEYVCSGVGALTFQPKIMNPFYI